MGLGVVGLVLLLAVLINVGRPLNQRYSAAEISYFKEVAFGVDSRVDRFFVIRDVEPDRVDELNKWSVDVRVHLAGYVSSADRAETESIVRELDELIEPISISVVLDPGAANIQVWLVPRSDFDQYLPLQNTSEITGAGQLWANDAGPATAVLLVASDQPDGARWNTLREEITQAFGLRHDSWRYPESVFYQGENEALELLEIDRAIIRLMYEPEIENRMTLEDLKELGL
jgi:hypothetical protein